MQLFGKVKPPVGVIFDSDIGTTVDSALALALLYGLDGKQEARVVGLSVSRSNLSSAEFVETVGQFYASRTTGPLAKFRRGLPVGLAANPALSSDTPMISRTLSRRGPDGSPLYSWNIKELNDTAEPRALIRNALTAQYDQNALVVCAGPLTNLAATLDVYGAKEVIARKVRMLVVAAGAYPAGQPESHILADIPAAKKVFAEWPTPVVAAGSEIGSQILFPAASIEKDFAYSDRHPIADAYRAGGAMPYDAPTWDMSAVLYAIRPNEGYFRLSDPGAITVTDKGRTLFTAAAGGKHRYLTLEPQQKERVLRTYVEIASAPPVERVLNFPKKKQEEEEKPAKPPSSS